MDAHKHETLKLTAGQAEGSCILRGEVLAVDAAGNRVQVALDASPVLAAQTLWIDVFYHCECREDTKIGYAGFTPKDETIGQIGDRVKVLHQPDGTLTVIGFEDGLPRYCYQCGDRFPKTLADYDDLMVRNGSIAAINVLAGCPPFEWLAVSEPLSLHDDYQVGAAKTDGRDNSLTLDALHMEWALNTAEVRITDRHFEERACKLWVTCPASAGLVWEAITPGYKGTGGVWATHKISSADGRWYYWTLTNAPTTAGGIPALTTLAGDTAADLLYGPEIYFGYFAPMSVPAACAYINGTVNMRCLSGAAYRADASRDDGSIVAFWGPDKPYIPMASVALSHSIPKSLSSTITYTAATMQCSATQTLTSSDGVSHSWRISAGGGSLSAGTGISVTLTAPATNPECASNATIQLYDTDCDDVEVVLDTINITYYPASAGSGEAYRVCTGLYCLGSSCYWTVRRVYCDGTMDMGNDFAAADLPPYGRCSTYGSPALCATNCVDGTCTDPIGGPCLGKKCSEYKRVTRTCLQKTQGCCPHGLFGIAECGTEACV